uniref:NADH-ubiquinone oxidoreductase chain 6 n=1 Tax=Synbranchus marmoratus TaxID=181452 RepID=Q8HL82_SYNMA|nr:NADH dehydrogenase subunit 6 [Synbranchus marmoratus]
MAYVMFLFLFGLMLGLVAIASNPSPYFAALGLVVVSGMACGVLVSHGGPFLSLVLFLVYLGGMLVVFAYSAALAAEPYPESWGSWSVFVYMMLYVGGVILAVLCFWGGWFGFWGSVSDEVLEVGVLRGDFGGVAMVYCLGGKMLGVGVWVLLLSLFVVLELVRGLSRGSIRAVY